jgi:glycosyltransferase involved in cell wall biosynthesis
LENKVLILTNDLNHEGGIVNYYKVWFQNKDYIRNNLGIEISHFEIGSRSSFFLYKRLKILQYPVNLVLDALQLNRMLKNNSVKYVQLNPSFSDVPIFRDAVFAFVAKLNRVERVVFFRGWKTEFESKVNSRGIWRLIFNSLVSDSKLIVLSSFFRDYLVQQGIDEKRVTVTTTIVDTQKIGSLNSENYRLSSYVFLGRLQPNKGIEELLDAFVRFSEIHSEATLDIIGHEYRKGYLNELRGRIKGQGSRIQFHGRLEGNHKFEVLRRNNFFVLPSYTEGCPNSLLEAIECGCCPLVTNVGCMPDVLKKIGYGYVFQSRNKDALYDVLIDSLSLEYEKRKTGLFDFKTVVLDLIDIYK